MKRVYIVLFGVCLTVWAAPALSQTTAAPFSAQIICRAAIGAIMGRDPAIVRVSRTEGGVIFLRYVRPNDKTTWSQRCRIEGNRILWASEPNGRWRNDPREEVITYEARGDGKQLKIIQRFADGSVAEETYSRKQF